MSVSYPLPPQTRQMNLVASAGQTVFGPSDFILFSPADVKIFVKAPSTASYIQLTPDLYTIAPAMPAIAFPAVFITTLLVPRGAGDLVRIQGARVGARTTDVTRAGVLKSQLLETELDRQVATEQELRRDLDVLLGAVPVDADYLAETIAARDAAQAAANALGNQVHQYDTRPQAIVANVPAGVKLLRLLGYADAGDGGEALYRRVVSAPTHPGKLQTSDGAWWEIVPSQSGSIRIEALGAKGDNLTDNSAAFTAAFSVRKALGAELRLGAGTFRIASGINYTTTTNFEAGLALRGAGSAVTIIDNRCPSGNACLTLFGTNGFSTGGYVEGMTFKSSSSSPVPAIDMKAIYRFTCKDLIVTGHLNGITITNLLGDADACNQILFKNCFFLNNTGAGLYHSFAAGIVQASFVRCEDCFFQGNGLCGWYYIGLSGSMENCAFTENGGNAGLGGLVIANNGISNAQFMAYGCVWENNHSISVRLNALQGAEFVNCEIAGGSPGITSSIGVVMFNSSRVRWEGTRVRVGPSLNPFTAFDVNANSMANVISNTFWQAFDAAGQTRYLVDSSAKGNRVSDSFDAIQVGTDVGVVSLTCANGVNNNVVVPLDGAFFGIAGPTAAFSINGLTNGFDGRKLELHNNSAQTLTINLDNAGSAAANRIRGDAGVTSYTVNNGGTVCLRYSAGTARWLVTGKG